MTSRYGKKLRQQTNEAVRKSKKIYSCPACSRIAVKRTAAGIWECSKCSTKFASDAYEFRG